MRTNTTACTRIIVKIHKEREKLGVNRMGQRVQYSRHLIILIYFHLHIVRQDKRILNSLTILYTE